MEPKELLVMMQSDLSNEYTHMIFYLHSAIVVRGLHRPELAKFFMAEAASEMQHVKEFGDMIRGMGGVPLPHPVAFDHSLTEPRSILGHIAEMEAEVVSNYAARRRVAEEIRDPWGGILSEFYSAQLQDSHKTVMMVNEMLKSAT